MEIWQKVRLKKIAKIVSMYCTKNEKILDVDCMNRHIKPFLPQVINYAGLDIRGECDVLCDLNDK